jgi:hypothetical protein
MVRKNALKKKPKLPPRRRIIQSRRRKATLAVFGILIVFLAGGLLYKQNLENQDLNRFNLAQSEQRAVTEALSNNLTGIIDKKEINICFNNEQGPFSNGRLWCRVSAALYFSKEISENDLYRQLQELSIKLNLSTKQTPKQSNTKLFWDKGVGCKIESYNGIAATSPGGRFLNNANSRQTILIVCEDRAKAKHYPFVY